jgi:predicted ribosomally synthesized peptide with SipW-like signal peptide
MNEEELFMSKALKGKFGLALASTALGAALIGGGTFALFTSETSNEGNTFTAGTLEIQDVTGGSAFSLTQYFQNLAPGDSENGAIKIKNNGTLDAWVKISGVDTDGDGDI